MAVSALPTPDSWEWFSETGKSRAPAWKNEVTLGTVEMLMEYEPAAHLERTSPTPLLMVLAALDHLTPRDGGFGGGGPGWRWQRSLPTRRRRSWRPGSGGGSCRRSRSWTPSSSGSSLGTRV
jgi:hypothetical protein